MAMKIMIQVLFIHLRKIDFKKTVAEVATLDLFSFLRHHKDNTYAYTFAAGYMQQFQICFMLLEFVCTP